MASQMRPPGGYPGATGPPPMMPPPADPMESEAPRLWESQGPPRTTPLVDPAGPLPSDIFQSAAAVPTQLYSSGTFPAAGFQSAASMAPPASPDGKPSLWKSSRGDGAEAAGVMQSAPAPAVSPAPGTFANPFATAGPSAQVGYSPGLSTSPFDQGPIPLATPPAKVGPVADAVGRGDVTLRVSRLLDLPKNSAAAGKYYVEVSTKDGQSAKIGPLEADPTEGITEDVETSSGDLTVTTGSQEILVKVLRKGMLSNTLIGESSIHRLDPRSRGKCAYALSSKDMPHPGGIELVVLERPPGKSAAAHEPECLLPSQHNVLAILDVEKLVMLPPVSGMSMRDQVEIRIEPLEKNVNPGTKKDLTFVLGPYPTRNDPTKAALRMVEVKDREGTHGVRREYKGMFRADRGGLMRLRISAWYQAVFGVGEEIGSIDVDVTFAAVPVNLQHMTKKGKEAGKAGSIYVGYKLVEEKTWREQEQAISTDRSRRSSTRKRCTRRRRQWAGGRGRRGPKFLPWSCSRDRDRANQAVGGDTETADHRERADTSRHREREARGQHGLEVRRGHEGPRTTAPRPCLPLGPRAHGVALPCEGTGSEGATRRRVGPRASDSRDGRRPVDSRDGRLGSSGAAPVDLHLRRTPHGHLHDDARANPDGRSGFLAERVAQVSRRPSTVRRDRRCVGSGAEETAHGVPLVQAEGAQRAPAQLPAPEGPRRLHPHLTTPAERVAQVSRRPS